MIYLTIEFPAQQEAQKAFNSAADHDMAGELHIRRSGDKWLFDLLLEDNPPAPLVRKWGGKIVDESGLDGRTYVALFGHERPIERKEEEEAPAPKRRDVRRKVQ